MIDLHENISRRILLLASMLMATLPAIVAMQFSVAAQTRSPLPFPPGAPAALIKRMSPHSQPSSQATVWRAGVSAPASTGFLLYRGDVIETAAVKVTVVFLDEPYAVKDNEVIIDANSRVGIASTYSWWGSVWAKVKGVFNSKTTYAQAGATGTEYQFTVINPSHSLTDPAGSTLVVLEGSVEVRKGPTQFSTANFKRLPESTENVIRYPQFVFASFTAGPSAQQRFSRTLDVPAGQITPFESTYHLHNECKQPHRLEFRTSDGTEWLRLEGAHTVSLAGGQSVAVPLRLSIDATRLPSGRFEAHVYAVCLDCTQEPRCPDQQLDYALSINVMPPLTPTPTPTPTVSPAPPSNQVFTVRALEESAITRNFDQPTPATPRIQAVLAWTNQVLLATQPTYAAQNLIPHFATTADRSQNFVTARERAILTNTVSSHQALGDVYSDWGQPAWAFQAYERELNRTGTVQPSNLYIDRGESLRLMGQLEEAARLNLSSVAAQSVKAQNLFGNIALDRARIALNIGNVQEVNARVEEANRYYALANAAAPAGQISPNQQGNGTVQSNIAEAHIVAGDAALQNSSGSEARIRFAEAARRLESIPQALSIYPFPVTDLGVAYRGLGDAAVLAGDLPAAVNLYGKAKSQHDQAIAGHRDFAEAYFNLGDLYDDLGDRQKAEDNYRLSIQARPEQPAAYYPLAMLVQDRDPDLAAALASVYLKLEREVFLRGTKAENARRLASRNPVVRPIRFGESGSTQISVPNLVNMTQSDALNAIKAAGFIAGRPVARTDSRPKDTVLEQKPAAGARAPRGSAIEIVVSTGVVEPIVPNVLNISQTDATTAIENAGLRVGKIELKSETKPKNTVVRQTPSAGKKVAAGSAVDLVVSAGKLVDVPNIVKEKEQTARKKLADKGLTVGTVSRRPDCDLVGKVIEQNPSRTKVEIGSAVDFVIGSVGEDPVTVPNFVGGSRYDVEAAIQERRFILSKVGTEETDNAREGTVIKQSPPPGTQFAKDCPVKIEITIAIPLTTVGNYVGLSELEARSQLSGIGLSADVRYRPSRDTNPGIVLDQSPPAGSRVRKRYPVMLAVSAAPLEQVPVPEVVRMTLLNARNTLVQSRLRLGAITYEDVPVGLIAGRGQLPPCTVTRQDPVQNTLVAPGTPVKLWVVPKYDANRRLDCLEAARDEIR